MEKTDIIMGVLLTAVVALYVQYELTKLAILNALRKFTKEQKESEKKE